MNSDPMDPTASFPYLVRTAAYNKSDWEAMYHTLKKVRRQWRVVAKLLTKAGLKVQARVVVYKEVVHTVFLYGSDICVVMGEVLKVIEGFHHRVARRISGNTVQRTGDGRW